MARGLGVAAAAYATYVGVTWYRYGHAPQPAAPDEQDDLLDRFMPVFDVVERHRIHVFAPAETTLAAACDQDLLQSPVVRAIFKGRALVLGATDEEPVLPRGLCAQVRSLGWVTLEERPGRELVFGAVTKPWESNVIFRSIPPERFSGFDEPGYVKIAWTLRADPVGSHESIFRTETRAIATDAVARDKFRVYWAAFSPGITLIRWLSLRPLRNAAEAHEHASRGDLGV